MNALSIRIALANKETTIAAKSESAMWNELRKVRDSLTDKDLKAGVRAIVTDEAGNTFKDITFRRNSKGKIEMPNAIKETCRRQVEKARKAAKEAAEKAAARKARKAEANRRYRARKKAEKAAAFEALNNRAAAEGRIGEVGEIELTAADLKQQN